MSLRRPTVARLLFTFDISPFCDVAQTSDCARLLFTFDISPFCDVDQASDCGTLVIYLRYKPFLQCHSNVRLWHACQLLFNISPLRGVA